MQELVLKKISRMKKRRMFRKMKWNSKTRNRTPTKREGTQNKKQNP